MKVEMEAMLYPVYVHHDDGSAYGLTFPDFPGCFAAADDLADVPRIVQEAVEVHFEGDVGEIPSPSAPEQWGNDDRFTGGYWMLVEIDLQQLRSTPTQWNTSAGMLAE